MNSARLPDDFVESLLAQDDFLGSPELAEHRRKVMERLGQARRMEGRARKFVLAACLAAFTIVGAIFAGAAYEITHVPLPTWAVMLVALVVILSPLTALLLICIYLFRYRLELARAKKAARDQALAEIPRQLNQLRQELTELRKQTGRADKPVNSGGNDEKGGFTLIELLTVLAIVAILSSLLLPALANAKARARIAACKNNLRQMAKGLTMYEADYHFFPGTGYDLISLRQPPWLIPSPDCWVAKISPYLANNSPVFICPDYQPVVTNSQSYGYNAGGSCQQNCPPYTLGLGLGAGFDFIALSSVAVPADMIALGDLQLPSNVFRFVITPWHKQPLGGVDSVIAPRHAGGSDMVFLDGHVEWAKRPRWIAETESSRLRWNNDHQPHPETW